MNRFSQYCGCRNPLKSGQGFNKIPFSDYDYVISPRVVIPLNRVKVSTGTKMYKVIVPVRARS